MTDSARKHSAGLVAAIDAVGPRMAFDTVGDAQIQLLLPIVLPQRLLLGGGFSASSWARK
jgi:hypothetical protein